MKSFSSLGTTTYIDGYNGPDSDQQQLPPAFGDFLDDVRFNGLIGIGCGLLTDPQDEDNPILDIDDTGKILVDWIRVTKEPITTPIISIGAKETRKGTWASSVSGSEFQQTYPFDPGPSLCDTHWSNLPRDFIIEGLEPGTYTITFTKGKQDFPVLGLNIDISEQLEFSVSSSLGSLKLDNTEPEEFLTGDIIIEKEDDRELYINIRSYDSSGGSWSGPDGWNINSIVIERGEKGIKFT
jgi:hypothetical protein